MLPDFYRDEILRRELDELRLRVQAMEYDTRSGDPAEPEPFGRHANDVEDISGKAVSTQFPYGSVWPFGLSISGTTATIYSGIFEIPNVGWWESAETDVSIEGGDPVWVYLTHPRTHPAGNGADGCVIADTTTVTYPTSNQSQIAIPLYKLTEGAGGWTFAKVCNGGRNILMGSPLR